MRVRHVEQQRHGAGQWRHRSARKRRRSRIAPRPGSGTWPAATASNGQVRAPPRLWRSIMNKQTTAKRVRREVHARVRPLGPRAWPLCSAIAAAAALTSACGGDDDDAAARQAALVAQGQQIFRFDTFGDEAKWTDTLRMHEVIAQRGRSHHRAVGGPEGRRRSVAGRGGGRASRTAASTCTSPATTVALLKLDAVVGLKGTVETVNGQDTLTRRRRHLRAVPLDGRRLVRARHRQAARRLAQPRPEPRRDHRAVAGARRGRPRRSSTPGARASTTRASTSTA